MFLFLDVFYKIALLHLFPSSFSLYIGFQVESAAVETRFETSSEHAIQLFMYQSFTTTTPAVSNWGSKTLTSLESSPARA